jgi:hypothetical protein
LVEYRGTAVTIAAADVQVTHTADEPADFWVVVPDTYTKRLSIWSRQTFRSKPPRSSPMQSGRTSPT